MKNPFKSHTPHFNANEINATIQRALAAAGLDTTSGPMHEVTETIRRALGPDRGAQAPESFESESVINVVAREVPDSYEADGVDEVPTDGPGTPAGGTRPGSFQTHTFSSSNGSRAYKLYTPSLVSDAPRAMVLMLHGCTQSADDFAAGTRMNQLADKHGFLVVYPEQLAQANASKCWNWFESKNQTRDVGEPALIAGIAREVLHKHAANPGRIFVAGLSAGAAMAVVLGQTYPELFAAVGAHSGLAYGSAHDMVSAMAAMKGGRSGLPGLQGVNAGAIAHGAKATHAVPLIVFHGDRDHVVQASNSASIVQQAREAFAAQRPDTGLTASTMPVATTGGRRFRRTVHTDAQGHIWIESWTVHGAGHAWSGGDTRGTYTDAAGPDASRHMVRFFLSQGAALAG